MTVWKPPLTMRRPCCVLPQRYRKRLRTTNSQERLNREIRRRERVIRIFPNAASAERLLGALLMEFDEAFSTGHRYFEMSEYWQGKQQQPQPCQRVFNNGPLKRSGTSGRIYTTMLDLTEIMVRWSPIPQNFPGRLVDSTGTTRAAGYPVLIGYPNVAPDEVAIFESAIFLEAKKFIVTPMPDK